MSAPEPREDDRGATLMLAWQGGAEGAFDALVEAYSGQVYALLTRFLNTNLRPFPLVTTVAVMRRAQEYRQVPNSSFYRLNLSGGGTAYSALTL